MKPEELDNIHRELLKQLDYEEQVERDIEAMSEEIATYLVSKNKAKAFINETPYVFHADVQSKKIILVVANEEKYKLAGTKYKPFAVTAEINNDLSMYENLKATVEAFIRHITGHIKPEVLDEEELLD